MAENSIETLLNRGTADVIVREDLEKKLAGSKPLRIKLGIDPTGFDLTLGHAVVLRKLKQFQDLGHQIVLLFGSFTAQIGDPSGKSQTRKVLTKEQVLENAKTYVEQAGKILDVDKLEIVYNGDWLEKQTFADVLKMAGNFTASHMWDRDMFQERIKQGQEVNLVEFLYPLMVAFDSVEVRADVEIGGTDQYFNLLCGRPMQKGYGQEPQNILTVPLLVGTDGVEKMSKSLGNYIALNDSATEMFGKTMSVPDNVMLNYFELCTDVDLTEAAELIADHPRNAKVRLAQEIVRLYHDNDAAVEALRDFEQKFVKKEVPDEMPEFQLSKSTNYPVGSLLVDLGFTKSNSEARRLVEQGAVKTISAGETTIVKNIETTFLWLENRNLPESFVLKSGKKNWVRLVWK